MCFFVILKPPMSKMAYKRLEEPERLVDRFMSLSLSLSRHPKGFCVIPNESKELLQILSPLQNKRNLQICHFEKGCIMPIRFFKSRNCFCVLFSSSQTHQFPPPSDGGMTRDSQPGIYFSPSRRSFKCNMSLRFCGPKFSLCMLLVSFWGIIQLVFMGMAFQSR